MGRHTIIDLESIINKRSQAYKRIHYSLLDLRCYNSGIMDMVKD